MDEKKRAIALRYDKQKDNAPKLVAKGQDYLAEKIIQIAKENKIPIVKDEKLLSVMYKMDIFEEIPPNLYRAVAKILVFVEKLKSKA